MSRTRKDSNQITNTVAVEANWLNYPFYRSGESRTVRFLNKYRVICAISLIATLACLPAWAKDPHYIHFARHDYIGWVQIILGDTAAPSLQYKSLQYKKKKNLTVSVGESGVVRTQTLFVHFFGNDEMYYRTTDGRGVENLVPLPPDYFRQRSLSRWVWREWSPRWEPRHVFVVCRAGIGGEIPGST